MYYYIIHTHLYICRGSENMSIYSYTNQLIIKKLLPSSHFNLLPFLIGSPTSVNLFSKMDFPFNVWYASYFSLLILHLKSRIQIKQVNWIGTEVADILLGVHGLVFGNIGSAAANLLYIWLPPYHIPISLSIFIISYFHFIPTR